MNYTLHLLHFLVQRVLLLIIWKVVLKKCKFLNGLPPPIMNDAFMIRNNKYNLRKVENERVNSAHIEYVKLKFNM